MASISVESGLILSAVLFGLGLIGVLARRNILFILLSIEIMLNAAGLAFVVAGSAWQDESPTVAASAAATEPTTSVGGYKESTVPQADGQVMFFFVLTMAAAEVSVGLALVLRMHSQAGSLDADALSRMRG
jgi:NADH-quinone oxidoreductase subunit K